MKKLELYEAWISNFQMELEKTYLRLKEIDDREMFAKDDDVGFVFTSILNIIDELNKESK